MFKKLLCVLLLCFILIGSFGCKKNENELVTKKSDIVIDIDISSIVDDNWMEYYYFWQVGKGDFGEEVYLITVYYVTFSNKLGVETYMLEKERIFRVS